MAKIKSNEPGEYNKILAEALKKTGNFNVPDWVALVKTGANKERPNIDPDFWYKRAASILRQIYIRQIVGVERLRSRYGGRKDRGVRPAEFRKAGGKIIRVILQQAEAAGIVEKSDGKHKGRKLTDKGRQFLESVKGDK